MKHYLADGTIVQLISRFSNAAINGSDKPSYIVCRVYDCPSGYDEEDLGDPFIVNEIYDQPPTKALNEEVVGLKEVIRKLNDERMHVVRDMHDDEQEHVRRMDAYKKYDALKHLDRVIAGEVTHYVVESTTWNPPTIIRYNEGHTHSCFYNKTENVKPRLLTLYGSSEGDLEWRLSQYTDHDGNAYTVHPCFSVSEAKAIAQPLVDGFFALKIEANASISDKHIAKCIEDGLEVSDDVLQYVYAGKRKQLTEDIQRAQEMHDGAVNNLKVFLQGEAADAQ